MQYSRIKTTSIPFYSVSVTASAAGWFGSLTLDVRSVRDSRGELSADEWQQNRDTPTHAGPQRTGSGNFKPEVQKPVQVQRDAGLGGAVSREPKENPRSSPKKVGEAGGRRGEQGQFQPGGRSKRTERAGGVHTDEQQRWAVRSREKSRSTAGQTEQLTGGFTSTAGNCCWRALKSCARPESNNNNKRKSN